MMKKTIKALVTAQLIALTIVTSTVHAAYFDNQMYVSENYSAHIDYVSTNKIKPNASVDGTTVTVSARITAKNGRTASSGTLCIEKKTKNGWIIKDSWEFSGKGVYFISKEYSAKKGKYRARVVADVGSDHIDSYSNEVTVN